MKHKLLTLAAFAAMGSTNVFAQSAGGGFPSSTGCYDASEYVDYKNGSTPYGAYTLIPGFEEKAAQSYTYTGSGTLTKVRVYGSRGGGVLLPIRVSVYSLDAAGRPLNVMAYNDGWWTGTDQFWGYKDVSLNIGISGNFAVAIELRNALSWQSFAVDYTGDGEGNGEDLASLAGTSTGQNWSSAMTNFSKDGDFRIVPYVTSDVVADFEMSSKCVNSGQTVSFSNYSQAEHGGMFNNIHLAGYTSPYDQYEWSFGDGGTSTLENPTHTYTNPGVYTVSLTVLHEKWDGSTCQATYTKDVSVGLNAATSNVVNASCYGSEDGAVTINATGGAAPYMYSLNGSAWQSNATFTNLPASTHSVQVMDDLGCEKSVSFTITQPSAIAFHTAASTNASCGQSNGSILLGATGGTGTIEYSINGGASQTSGSFSGLASGSYLCTAEDANGCVAEMRVMVNDQGGPVLVLSAVTNISCNGGNDGSITVLGSGGTGALQYSVDGVTFQTGTSFTGLEAGVYSVVIRDAAGCQYGFSVELYEPNPLSVVANATEDVSCFDGSDGVITVTNSIGGIGAHAYSLDGVNFQSSGTFTGVNAGSYTITVRDAAGCTASTTTNVYEPAPLSATAVADNLDCYQSNDGSITVTTSGGTAPFEYQIAGSDDWQSDNVFADLAAGTYQIIVRDDNGCTYSFNKTITQPTMITATFNIGAATCGSADGTIGVAGSGGSGSGYQYSIDLGINWSSSGNFTNVAGGNYIVLVQDGTGCVEGFNIAVSSTNGPSITNLNHTDVTCYNGNDGSIAITAAGGTGVLQYSIGGTFQPSGTFNGLPAGLYYVTVRDAVGCFDSDTVRLDQGSPINVAANVMSNVLCNGGNDGVVNVTAAGGIGTMAFSLNGVNFQSTGMFTNLAAGTYIAYVRDAGSCMNATLFTVTQPSAITANAGALDVTCNGDGNGAIFVTANGGTGSLEYSISSSQLSFPFGSANSWNNLDPDTYTVVVRDDNNCLLELEVDVTEPTALAVTGAVDNVNCAGGNDGSITVSVTGGTMPYLYAWPNGSTSSVASNLSAGNYSVLIQDGNGCEQSANFTVAAPTMPLIINGTSTGTTTASSTDGAVDITVTGGTAPYSFEWSNGATTEDLSGVGVGFYSIIVTDANGCATANVFPVSVSTGVEEIEALEAAVIFYPNPASTVVAIEVQGFENQPIESVRVFDAVGKMIHFSQTNDVKVELDVTNFVSGLYMVQIEVNGLLVTKKLNVAK